MFFSRSLLCAGIFLISHGAYATDKGFQTLADEIAGIPREEPQQLSLTMTLNPQPCPECNKLGFSSAESADSSPDWKSPDNRCNTCKGTRYVGTKLHRNVELNFGSKQDHDFVEVDGPVWEGTTECFECNGRVRCTKCNWKGRRPDDNTCTGCGLHSQSLNTSMEFVGQVSNLPCPHCKEGSQTTHVVLYRIRDAPILPPNYTAFAPEGARWILRLKGERRNTGWGPEPPACIGFKDDDTILAYCPEADGSDDLPRSDPSHWLTYDWDTNFITKVWQRTAFDFTIKPTSD